MKLETRNSKQLKDNTEPIRPPVDLRFWESAGQMGKIAEIGDKWWDKVQGWLNWLPQQIDVDNAPIELVNLIAYQRDISRFQNEEEQLYRRRVKYAFLNAKSAGEYLGFFEIWQRLQLGMLEQQERISKEDWDVIQLVIDEDIFAKNQQLFDFIIRKYGRTCRRYWYTTQKKQPLGVRAFEFEYEDLKCVAKNTKT